MFVRHVVKKSALLRLRHENRCRVFRKLASAECGQGVPLGSPEWSRLISLAEAQVDCPYTFTTRDWLLVDELTQDSPVYLRKLVENICYSYSGADAISGSHKSVPWPLFVLLFAKAVSHNLKPQSDMIHEKLNLLSKATEIVRISQSLHNEIYDSTDEGIHDSHNALNKVSLLMGDYFLAKTMHILFEKIKSCEVSVAILSAIRDFSESRFIGTSDAQNVPIPARPIPIPMDDINTSDLLDAVENEWANMNILNGASLLGRSCESVMVLLNQSRALQTKAYQFGVHSALAWHAAYEKASFTSAAETFSLVGAPVLLALKTKPALYDYIVPGKRDASSVDYEGLRLDISKTNALAHTGRICLKHAAQAKSIIDENIGSNMASRTLKSLISIHL